MPNQEMQKIKSYQVLPLFLVKKYEQSRNLPQYFVKGTASLFFALPLTGQTTMQPVVNFMTNLSFPKSSIFNVLKIISFKELHHLLVS